MSDLPTRLPSTGNYAPSLVVLAMALGVAFSGLIYVYTELADVRDRMRLDYDNLSAGIKATSQNYVSNKLEIQTEIERLNTAVATLVTKAKVITEPSFVKPIPLPPRKVKK